MTLMSKALISILSLVFLFNTARGNAFVNKLETLGPYSYDVCNVDVTCYVYSSSYNEYISWTCKGGPYGISRIDEIPGFRVGQVLSDGDNKYRQTISITKCYSRLEITCRIGTSSKSIILTSGLSVGAIIGIVMAVVFVLACIIGGIMYSRRRRATRGVVVGGGFVTPVTNMYPPSGAYPAQPQPMVYPGTTPQQQHPSPYTGGY